KIYRAPDVYIQGNTRHPRPHLLAFQPAGVDLHEYDWYRRKYLIAMMKGELKCRVGSHNYKVDFLVAIHIPKMACQISLEVGIAFKASTLHVLDIEVDRPRS